MFSNGEKKNYISVHGKSSQLLFGAKLSREESKIQSNMFLSSWVCSSIHLREKMQEMTDSYFSVTIKYLLIFDPEQFYLQE